MKSLFRLLAFTAAVCSIASCGRATYSLNSQLPLQAGPERKPQPSPVGIVSAASIVLVTTPAAGATLTKPTPVTASTTLARPSEALSAAASKRKRAKVGTITPVRLTHSSFMQRVLLKRMTTQLRKVQVARQNVAQIEKGQAFSKVGRAAIIALVGAILVAIVIGASANSIENATVLILLGIIGYALLVTGIVLLVIGLVNGS